MCNVQKIHYLFSILKENIYSMMKILSAILPEIEYKEFEQCCFREEQKEENYLWGFILGFMLFSSRKYRIKP